MKTKQYESANCRKDVTERRTSSTWTHPNLSTKFMTLDLVVLMVYRTVSKT
jgi:hypothetical protein